MKKELGLVNEFHKKFNVPTLSKPSLIPSDRSNLRYSLMEEEVKEYIEGAQNGDLENIAKELCDILYGVYGTILEHGLQDKIEDIFKEVHNSHMSKEYHQYKMVKGEKYFKPNIVKFFKPMEKLSSNINAPQSPSEISAKWLNDILFPKNSNSEIVSIEIDKDFGPSSLLGKAVRVKIDYADAESEPKSVIVKFQISCSDKKREGEIYRLLAEDNVSFVPRVYGKFGDGNLVMEDLSLTHSVVEKNQEFTINQARNVVSMLAQVNSRFWGNLRVPKDDVSHFINSININMGEGWDIFKNRYSAQLGQETVAFEWMWKNRETVSAYYNSGPAALIHGDVNKGNLLFPNDGNDKPKLIDWQLSGQKVLPFDLSYFIVRQLTVEQRREHEGELLKEYYRLLPDHIRDSYSFDRLQLDYRACTTRSMLSAVTIVGPKFSSRPDRFERADVSAARIIAAVQDLKPVEAIEELEKRGLLK